EGDVYYQIEVTWVDGNSTARIAPKSEYIDAAESESRAETAREQRTASGFSLQSRALISSTRAGMPGCASKPIQTKSRFRASRSPRSRPMLGSAGGNETVPANPSARSWAGAFAPGRG